MVPDRFIAYFAASAGAGAALIGLLFVAVSISPEATFGSGAHPARKGVASAAFTALTNAFFVSMWALIPLANVGLVALVVSVVDVILTLGLGRDLVLNWREPGSSFRRGGGTRLATMLALALALYTYQAVTSLGLLLHPHAEGNVVTLAGILLGVYVLGLGRAWELLGARREGLGGWVNPLRDEADASLTPAPMASGVEPPTITAPVQPTPQPTDAPAPAPKPVPDGSTTA